MNRVPAELLVGVRAARGSSAAEPSPADFQRCQEPENKHISMRNGFAVILQPPASPSFDLFFIQDPKGSRSDPHALNLLS